MRRHVMVVVAGVLLAALHAASTIAPRAEAQTNYVMSTGVSKYQCLVTAVTAATQCQAAPAAGLRLYVTDVVFSNNVGTAQTMKLVTGTGSNCASSTADLSHAVQFGAAVGNFDKMFITALQAPAASAVCVTPSAATSVSATVVGFIAP